MSNTNISEQIKLLIEEIEQYGLEFYESLNGKHCINEQQNNSWKLFLKMKQNYGIQFNKWYEETKTALNSNVSNV